MREVFVKTARSLSWIFCAAVLMAITGCAGSSTFMAYPSRVNPFIDNVKNRKPMDVAKCDECAGSDQILHNIERGRIAQLTGNTDLSMKYFNAAIEKIKEDDKKATISASSVGANVAAVAINDNAIPYEGDGYERIMIHHYQALNYLKKKNLDDAGVEFRIANSEQDQELKRYEDEVDKAKNESENKDASKSTGLVEQRYAQMDEVAGKVKNSFQNAYSFYLSGLLYELLRQPNDAYIDYKKALEIYPDNVYLQKDVIRLAASLDMRDDLAALTSRFKIDSKSLVDKADDNSGELVVLYEDGFVPQKKEIKIPLPIPRVGIVAIAFPIYDAKWSPNIPLTIRTMNDQLIGSTETISDFRALATKSLKEKIPAMTVRQFLRAASKGATAKLAKDNGGLLGEVLASAWNIISENADLRSWLTLPNDAQILRASLPAGVYQLALNQDGGNATGFADVEVPAKGKVILYVVRAGNQFYATPISIPSQPQSAHN